MTTLSRRAFLSGISATGLSIALAGCISSQQAAAPPPMSAMPLEPLEPGVPVSPVARAPLDDASGRFDYAAIYGPVDGDRFPIPPIDLRKINPAFLRAEVSYSGDQEPGTIIIDPHAHYLYHLAEGGRATRYGVGVGREGFVWSGTATIKSKQEWPDWYPPKEMIARQPELRAKLAQLQSGIGMPGGPGNPLGARAMYLWQNGKDTLFRIHGTVEPWTIGKSVSSGCIRMINQDVLDLYARVPEGTKVVVLGSAMPMG
jgi:lipoprotein-anchoring transpeptidase ErfK/SrfK